MSIAHYLIPIFIKFHKTKDSKLNFYMFPLFVLDTIFNGIILLCNKNCSRERSYTLFRRQIRKRLMICRQFMYKKERLKERIQIGLLNFFVHYTEDTF